MVGTLPFLPAWNANVTSASAATTCNQEEASLRLVGRSVGLREPWCEGLTQQPHLPLACFLRETCRFLQSRRLLVHQNLSPLFLDTGLDYISHQPLQFGVCGLGTGFQPMDCKPSDECHFQAWPQPCSVFPASFLFTCWVCTCLGGQSGGEDSWFRNYWGEQHVS